MSGLSTEPKKSVALVKMIPLIYEKPCVLVNSRDASVFVSKRIFGISIEWFSIGQLVWYEVNARNTWVDPPRKRPDSLTDGLSIGSDCLEVGPLWWFDTYFRWWFVFKPEFVGQSQAADHSWVRGFLRSRSRHAAGRQRKGRKRGQ
jgi:hypothetical protein